MKKRTVRGCMAAILVIMLVSTSFAAEIGNGLDLGGQMRWRIEYDGKDFDYGTAMNEMSLLRTQVNLKVTAIEDAVVYFQVQDSRNLGVNSAGLTNDTNLGVHQGYLKLKNLFGENLSLQLGRFEAPYGRMRLMGNVGWSNVGRSFDGIRVKTEGETFKANIFILKVIERSFNTPPDHRDWKLYGIYSTFLQDRLDVFILYDWDSRKVGNNYSLARYTIGGLFKQKLESGLGYVFDAALQTGDQAADDISAYMVAGDIYYHMDSKLSKVGIGFDITSGDDDLTDDKNKWFNNLYYTAHKFRGYMDYFIADRTDGLMDLILRGTIKPFAKGSIDIDIHHFQTMEDHIDASDTTIPPGTSKAIGQELDITFTRPIQEGLGFQGGVSAFFASDEWIYDVDPAFWIYLMLTAGF
ncbi:MAG: alginate export family protein [Candidatus Zixiibacteriota bacterium]|nr:MAG: alginate export family protein [candidate division Zixibacteria bacterium]